MTSSMVPRSSLIAAARLSTPTGPPSNFSMTVSSSLRSSMSKPSGSTSSMLSAASATSPLMMPAALTSAKSRTRRSSRLAMRGVPRDRSAMRSAPSGCRLQLQNRRAADHDFRQFLGAVELQPLHDAEAIAQRRGQQTRPGRGAHQGEGRQVELDRARARGPRRSSDRAASPPWPDTALPRRRGLRR